MFQLVLKTFKCDTDLKLTYLLVHRLHTTIMFLVLGKGDSSNACNYFHRLNDLRLFSCKFWLYYNRKFESILGKS